MSARARILERVRAALQDRSPVDHPGDFAGARPPGALDRDRLVALTAGLEAAGAEVVVLASRDEARAWLRDFEAAFGTACVGETVPAALAPTRPSAPPHVAELSVGRARCAVAETGSLVLDARDGRRAQLLAPTHLVWLDAGDVHATLREALRALEGDLPSALGLHSGPSKSADIGQILVRGVHGPGRLVVGILADDASGLSGVRSPEAATGTPPSSAVSPDSSA